MTRKALSRIAVRRTSGDPRRGILTTGGFWAPCALGSGGITRSKREGDGATPAGHLAVVAVFYRRDRGPRPVTSLPVAAIRPDSGWCDDPLDRRYNRPVRLPYPGSHERLWRDDRLYDTVIVLDHNLANPMPGAGSAIFLHLAAPGFAATAGCIAVAPATMRRLLAVIGRGTVVDVR